MGRDEGAGREEVEPQEFEEDSGAQGRLQPEGQERPEHGGEEGAVDEAQVKGEAGQPEQGKKKPPPARMVKSCRVIMTVPGGS
ncbi:hypothetical protein JCM14713_32110 [Desulfomicrobium salsuginis]